MKVKTTLLTAGVLVASLMAASPAVLAERHGKHNQNGKWDKQELCENFREGKGPFNREERRAERETYRAEMADRLKLNEEQRQIWAEIHQERQAKQEKRMNQWQEKMQQRCSNSGKQDKE
ncbi:hypothetical protein Q672_03295 [Marinobacter sp. EVN1]|jgi:hypothetical protein|uniref:Uncharacterized protein n=1 Tax=Marinobacter nauticus TaxID=2743 RepID=A0A368UX58_MARNT|nr:MULTISPECIES: hypothetical protein [Marinobacter]ERS84508.1 hypothetical protein Q672_03295 [Marinobacter sp. EVN1]ERS89828.1 hypothetical protein Q667_11535 [Marinobacter sp. C1S70]MBY5961083.1 hypothetical protein [Marinobacter nauticus]MBY6104474.1 hypothetical protein [Marinobacter nauticus]RBP72485.1 hypothetical protein DET64_10783 [Marinobacter nauticus]